MKNKVEKMASAMSRVTRVGSSHSGPAANALVGDKSSIAAMGTALGTTESGCGLISVTEVRLSCIDSRRWQRETLGLHRGVKFASRFITKPSEVDATRSTIDNARYAFIFKEAAVKLLMNEFRKSQKFEHFNALASLSSDPSSFCILLDGNISFSIMSRALSLVTLHINRYNARNKVALHFDCRFSMTCCSLQARESLSIVQ
jgi:hypothetical protein